MTGPPRRLIQQGDCFWNAPDALMQTGQDSQARRHISFHALLLTNRMRGVMLLLAAKGAYAGELK